jgi:hypothetical protein
VRSIIKLLLLITDNDEDDDDEEHSVAVAAAAAVAASYPFAKTARHSTIRVVVTAEHAASSSLYG